MKIIRLKRTNEIEFINEFKNNFRCLSLIINMIDPDAIVFGGGLSNEIDFLDQIKEIQKYLSNINNIEKINLKTVFSKTKIW